MDKSNLELFKQAISEGLSAKFDSVVDSYTDEIVCSDRHKLAMRAIVYGKTDGKRNWSPKTKWIVAILVAAALVLTSCGIIFRNEIREVFEEFFVKYVHYSDETTPDAIEEVYELSYLPDGYYLKDKKTRPLRIEYEYVNDNNDTIIFEQRVLDESGFAVDSECGYSHMNEIDDFNVYYRFAGEYYNYLWNDNEYAFHLTTNQELSSEEIKLIIKGTK